MVEPELEEGEACYYKGDTSIDPDIALSYIDEKLQTVLGHFQKDFEGGVSAENLGAKFGGYGSFLPTYQRSPSVRSYPKTPQRSQNNITSKSPNNFHLEGVPQNSLVPSDVPIPFKHVSTSLGMHSLHDSTSADGSVKTDSCLLSPQIEAKVPAKHEPFSTKSVNPTDQKTLRVRIKMGSDNAARKNAAIYCGLGLISPSSSTGHSPDESGGEPLESQENPDESPASILQCMTSFPVAGAVLLSPLHDNLLHLIRKEDLSLDSNSSIPIRHRQKVSAESVDDSASVLGNIKVSKDKKTKSIGKVKTLEETKRRVGVDFEDNMISLIEENMEIETLERKRCFSTDLKLKPLSTPKCDIGESLKCAGKTLEVHRESKKDVPLKKRDVNKDWVKERLICTGLAKEESVESMYGRDVANYEQRAPKSSLVEKIGEHRVRSSEKDISVDPMGGGRTKGNSVPILFKPEHDVSKSEKDYNSAPINRLKQKVGLRGTQNEQDRIEPPQGKKKFSLEGKHKSKGRQSNSKLTSNLADESLRSGVCKLKSKKTAQKDVAKLRASYDDILDIRSGHMANQMNPLERPSGDRVKDYNLETVKEKEATNDGPCTQGLSSEMELASVAPLIIEENWVQCDSCEKWRLLPYGTKPDQLPDNWLCSMLNWLPGMNRCDISQDKTEKALRALYQPAVPLTESLNNFPSHSDQITGVTSADVQSFSQNYQNLSSDAMQNRGKKKHKAKEIPHAVSNCGLIQTSSLTKNLRQEDLRNRSLNDKDQVLLKRSKMNNSTTQRPDKSSSFALERYADKQKEKQVDEGATKGRKMKAKRESDQYEYESSKRIKTEAALHPDEYWNSENAGNLGKAGLRSSSDLPNRTAGKDLQKATERHNSKDETRDLKDRLLISAKKQRDTTLVFPDSGSLEIKTGNEREIYAKKRKLKDWQDSQNNSETLQSNGNRHPDGKVSWMEENVNSEYRKENKSRLSKTEGQESSTSRGEDRSNRKGKVTRILLSGRRDNSSVKNDQQQKNIEKVASQITLDNMDLLKKDLGSELFSTASTSSSSKVSDSRKRSICQEVKGSSVESVSSSPMKTSNQYKVSSTRRGSSGKDYAKIGDSPVMGAPRKSLEQKNKLEGNRTGTARKGESSGVFQSDLVGCPGLEFREHDGSGKAESSVEPPLDFKNNHLSADGALTQQLPCPTDVHASDHCNSEERMNTKINLISGKGSSLLSNDKEKSSYNVQKVTVKFSDQLSEQGLYPKNIQRDEMQIDHHQLAQHHEDIDAKKHVSDGCNITSKDDKNVGMKDSENWEGISQREIQTKIREHNETNANLGELCSVDGRATLRQNSEGEIAKRNPTQVESRFGKIQVNLRHAGKQDTLARGHQPISGSLKGSGFAVQPVDGSGDLLKVLQQPGNSANQNGTHQSWGNPVADLSVSRDLTAPNPMKGDFSSQTATNVLKEAERLRGCADHLKNSGFKFESNMTYFQAALKFLLGASLLETSKYESSKHGEMSQIQIYNSTAKLCETCAHEFEKQEEMAATALAYKCMEVAYMRVVYCKSSSTNRDRHDLQASLQMVPQGESPSSSASDIDNLNNQVTVDKTALSRGMASNTGNHLIVARKRPSFVRLLDFMNDVSSAMEASRRSQVAFAAANVILEKAQNNEGVISVKRVIDFSFQDVEELLRLVRLAFEATSLQCFRENMD